VKGGEPHGDETRDGLPPGCPRRYGADCVGWESKAHLCACRRVGQVQAGLVPPVVKPGESPLDIRNRLGALEASARYALQEVAALRRLIDGGA
jgi:hypothetical protein